MFVHGETSNWEISKTCLRVARAGTFRRSSMLVHWTFGFLATLARITDKTRLDIEMGSQSFIPRKAAIGWDLLLEIPGNLLERAMSLI